MPIVSRASTLRRILLAGAVCVVSVAGVVVLAGRAKPQGIAACVDGPRPGAELARCLVERVSPDEFERALFTSPDLAQTALPALAAALVPAPSASAVEAAPYVAAAARARSRRLSALGAWTEAQGEAFLRLQLVDAERFVEDAAFRARVLTLLPGAFDPAASPDLRDQMLYSINSIPGVGYDASERIELAWGAIPRASGPREAPYDGAALRFPDDSSAAISASIYSFPAPFLDPDAVARFITEMRRLRPDRALVALVDLPMRNAVAEPARAAGVTLVETHGRDFSPWPRDPFSVLRREDGGVTLLVRPNAQRQRAADNDMARELIQGLPARLDAAWGAPTWTRGPVPFHNGQILIARDAVWVSVFTLERRALQILGAATGPSEGVTTNREWRAFREASARAARELSDLYQKPVKLVHDLPDPLAPGTIDRLAGGGGFDLDSLMTVLDRPDDGPRILVADVNAGETLAAEAADDDLARFAAAYGLGGPRGNIRDALRAAQRTPRARGLAWFLDEMAAHLEAEGASVERLPLLVVPVAMLNDRDHLQHDNFLVTWNNVVLEPATGGRRAEGFTSMLAAGDDVARAAFGRAGYAMDFAPLLAESVILNGGYRCASQHVR